MCNWSLYPRYDRNNISTHDCTRGSWRTKRPQDNHANDRDEKHGNEEGNIHRLRLDLEYFVNKTDRGDEKYDDDPQHDFTASTGSIRMF